MCKGNTETRCKKHSLAVAPFHNLTECEAFRRLNLSGLYMHRAQYYALPIRLEQAIPYLPKGPVL